MTLPTDNIADPSTGAPPTSTWTTYTRDDALAILASGVFEHQRPVRPRHVDYLARLMTNGDFEGSEIKFAQLPDGRRFLINGQHRLHAIVRSECPQTLLCTVVPAVDLKQVSVLYAAEDRGLARNVADTYRAFGLLDTLNIGATLLGRGAAAMALIAAGFDRSRYSSHRVTDAQRVRLLEAWAPELQQWQEIVGAPGHERFEVGRLNNAGVLAVALVTLRYQEARAIPFWSAVRENDGLKKGTPERTLVDYVQLRMGQRTTNGSAVASYVAAVWNSYFSNRPTTSARPLRSLFILILGSPYSGDVLITADDSPVSTPAEPIERAGAAATERGEPAAGAG